MSHIAITTIFLLLSVISRGLISKRNKYPDSVPSFPVRIDIYSNKTVSSGHLHGLNGKLSLHDFKQRLQCAIDEPNFDYNSGSASFLRSIPPTKDIVELMCSYGEVKCNVWSDCEARRNRYLSDANSIPKCPRLKLYRVVKGKLYYDWPWRVDRLREKFEGQYEERNQIVPLMQLVLDKVSDIPDSVFFAGGETPSLPYNIPFPIFSMGVSMEFADMPWPWIENFNAARAYYRSHTMGKTQNDVVHHKVHSHEWSSKKNKAAFFASYDDHRGVMFDAARRYPDTFEAAFEFPAQGIRSWNPSSRPALLTDAMKQNLTVEEIQKAASVNVSGSGVSLLGLTPGRPYNPHSYKYIIVPMGSNGMSTSGRLANLLLTSGAVILLQRTPLSYHFSAHLVPWVHFVPLTYSGADVAEKVQWLRDHDDLARQIAENGRAFARSYLRLEDYYCYAAAALEMVGELEKGSDALEPFNPQPLDPFHALHVLHHVGDPSGD